MPIRAEPLGEGTVNADHAATQASLLTTHAPQAAAVEEGEDNGVIEIFDRDEDDETALDGLYNTGTLFDSTGVLTAGEESPPLLRTRDYAAAFFNTDPRIAFDALHIGALRAIEECEGMTRSAYDYPPWYVPPAKFVVPASSTTASVREKPFFTVPAMHPLVQSRPPIERQDQQVDRLLSNVTREALMQTIGPDILEKLRLHRSREVQKRERRASREPPKKRAA